MRRLMVVGIVMAAVAQRGAAQDLGGLFSQDGVEVRADARVFTLFALFNALGYDRETRQGPTPLKAPLFTSLRQELRVELLPKAPTLDPARRFVEQNPWALGEYVERTLRLGQPPAFAAAEGADEAQQQLSTLLQDFFKKHAAALYEAKREPLRVEAKAWLTVLDKNAARGREMVRLSADDESMLEDEDEGDAPRLIIVVNPLDAHGSLFRGRDAEARYLVVGPGVDETEPEQAVLVAALRDLLRPEVHRALKAQDPVAVGKALAARGVAADAVAKPDEVLVDVFAALFASRTLNRNLAEKHSAAIPAALLKAGETATDWYLQQKEPFSALAAGLVGRTLGLKTPEVEAPKRGS